MLGQKNILVIWHLFGSFPNKFVMCGVTIESPIESPMVSPTILNSSGSRVQDRPYRGYLYPPKTNYISRLKWPGTTLPLETGTSTSNCEGSGELPSHYLLPESQSCVIVHLSWRFLHESNCLDCVVFASGCILWRQSFRQHKCSRIVFMYGDIHGSFPIGSWTDFVTELTMSYYRKQLSAACRKSYEFGFYRR